VIELMNQHPNFSDLQIAQIISERHSIVISRATINRLRHIVRFKFLLLKHCETLTEVQWRQRIQFTKDFFNGRLPVHNLIFGDESRFCMGLDN
jgi:hypothetical protein